MILSNARLIMPDGSRSGWLDIRDGRIADRGDGTAPGLDLGGRYVAPGFVDMHVHGGGGAPFADDPISALNFHRLHGTTTAPHNRQPQNPTIHSGRP